jgi:hypothetical protein
VVFTEIFSCQPCTGKSNKTIQTLGLDLESFVIGIFFSKFFELFQIGDPGALDIEYQFPATGPALDAFAADEDVVAEVFVSEETD